MIASMGSFIANRGMANTPEMISASESTLCDRTRGTMMLFVYKVTCHTNTVVYKMIVALMIAYTEH